MSGLIEKVRDKVRGRSVTRDESNSGMQTSQRVSKNMTDEARESSPTLSAWHVHKGNRNSTEQRGAPPVPPIPSSSNRQNYEPDVQDAHAYPQSEVPAQGNLVARGPDHLSSVESRGQRIDGRISEGQTQNVAQYPYTVPRRKESLPQNRASHDQKIYQQRKSIEQKKTSQQMEADQHYSAVDVARPPTAGTLPEPQRTGNLGTEIDQALASLSVNDAAQQRATQSGQGVQTNEPREHLRVPTDFNLGSSERTVIDTQWRPAVTHEERFHEKTEIIREAITRDIHVHHYYTYVQPIKVVEVLPAKHYYINPKTGLKVEIPAPKGWVMPKHLQPQTEDTSELTGWTRHYLVNEQHPHGVLESPPTSDTNGAYVHTLAYPNSS